MKKPLSFLLKLFGVALGGYVCVFILLNFVFSFDERDQLTPERNEERIKFALNIENLPEELSIHDPYLDNWTDYIFLAEIRIDKENLDELLKGRNWKHENTQGINRYSWKIGDGMEAMCTLDVEDGGGKVLLHYSAD